MSTSAAPEGSSPYEAPLLHEDLPVDEYVPGEYEVVLVPGHSLEQHSAAIQRDITPYILEVVDRIKHRVVYWCQGVDDELLKAIRADPKVQQVARNGRVFVPKTWDWELENELSE